MVTWTFKDLGSHVIRSALERSAELGDVLIRLDFDLFGSAKISNLDSAIFSYKNVRAFEVPVNDWLFMQVIQSFQNLFAKSRSFRLTQFTILTNVILKTAILYQLKHNLYCLVVRAYVKTIVLDNVRMVQFF